MSMNDIDITKKTYEFSDAYDIKGKGVLSLNLERAVKSEGFVRSIADIARGVEGVSDIEIIKKAVLKKHRCDPAHAAIERVEAQLNPWISVKGGLPEMVKDRDFSEDVLVTIRLRDGRRYVSRDTYIKSMLSWERYKNVMAWCPLPQPYKGE